MACSTCGADHAADTSCDTLVGPVAGSGTLLAHGVPPPPDGVLDDPLIGETFGSFRVVRKLGRGGMGTVYLGEHALIGSRVAIKVLHEHLAHDAALVQRFYDEARAVNVIGHENIVSIFDMNVLAPRRYYLVMEYLEGTTLASLAKKPLEPGVVLPILLQICDALQAAHERGIVHRDLKPENVFLVKRNRVEHFVKLMDFGIAKLMAAGADHAQTQAGLIIGTPEYMAPEQTSGEPVDGRADLYALGVMMYQLATGRLPFSGGGITGLLIAHRERPPTPPHEVNPAIPEAWSSLILKALAKRPDQRFQSARELAGALEQFGRSGAGVHVPPSAPPPGPVAAATPEPLHSRHAATFVTRVEDPASGRTVEMTCSDLSRGGMFLSTDGPFPPVFTRLRATLLLPDGPLPCTCEVVRHVTVDQARAWGMSSGFGVQFAEPGAAFKERIDRIVRGLPYATPKAPAPAVQDDPEAAAQLTAWRKRINGDHYVLLGLPPDAEFDQIRTRARECRGELEALERRPLSDTQRQQVRDLLARLGRIQEELNAPRSRARLDAHRGNFRGVARCVAAGLSATEMELLRRDYLATHPGEVARAHLHFVTGRSWEAARDLVLALEEFESALKLDPLNLEIQQRYWTLKRKVEGAGARA